MFDDKPLKSFILFPGFNLNEIFGVKVSLLVFFDFNKGIVVSNLNILIPSICALDEYVVSFFAIEFKFLKNK